jgi:hypothetical protein
VIFSPLLLERDMSETPVRGLRLPAQQVSGSDDAKAVRRTRRLIKARHLAVYDTGTNVLEFPTNAWPCGGYPTLTQADIIWPDNVDPLDPTQPWPPKDGDL